MFPKTALVFIALAIVCVNSAPAADQKPETPVILKYNYEPNANNDGGYRFEYETSDGQSRTEIGTLEYVGEGEDKVPIISMNGIYSYVGPDGVTYTVSYISDQNGFRPYGDHLPGVNAGGATGVQPAIPTEPQFLPPNAIASLIG